MAAYDLRTGGELWRCESLTGEVVASPIHSAGLVLAGTSDGRFAAIRPDGTGDVTRTNIVWSVEDNVPSICSPVSNGKLVFLLNSGGMVVCHELEDGQKVWEKDLAVSFLASSSLAGNRLYLLSDYGEMFILRAGPTFELLNRTPLGEGREASPAFQAGRIYLRSKESLFCVGTEW